ncbi:hypothetical protein niasHT_035177 [Heterodera trifolii]|uniref:Uncharacterized protein n=1 Tax=Heterodera trifolii TaxID=157864 RepID=A0ABD2IYF2_9BILA
MAKRIKGDNGPKKRTVAEEKGKWAPNSRRWANAEKEATNGKWAQKGRKGQMPSEIKGHKRATKGQMPVKVKAVRGKSEGKQREGQMGTKGPRENARGKGKRKANRHKRATRGQKPEGKRWDRGTAARSPKLAMENSGESLGGAHRGEGTVLDEAANPWRAKCNRRRDEARGGATKTLRVPCQFVLR